MKTLLPFAMLAALPASAIAQSCLGTVGQSVNGRVLYAGPTVDVVNSTNSFGGRFGAVNAPAKGKPFFVHVGARSLDGGGKSILTVDLQFGGAIVQSAGGTRQLCAFAGVEAVNLSDAENGYANVPFGLAFGTAIASGGVTLAPFGVVGGNLASTGESEMGDFSAWAEGGLGFRFAGGITLTPSLRQSFQEGAEPIVRVMAMFPFGRTGTAARGVVR